MPFVPVLDTVLAELRFQQDVQRVENTLYFRMAGGWDTAQMATLGQDLIDWWAANLAVITSNTVKLVEVAITDLTTSTSPSLVVTPSALTTGGDSNEAEPNNVSLAISFRTSGRGRSSRGRNYFVGITTDHVAQNNVTEGFITSLKAAYEAIGFGGSFTDDSLWVVVSRFLDNAPRVTGLAQQVLSVSVVDSVIDSQRRRLPGRGR